MYWSKTETNIDMRNDTHRARIHAKRYQELGKDMPIAVIIGGPTLDEVSSMVSYRGVDDWDVQGGFYGEPAKIVKCETSDLTDLIQHFAGQPYPALYRAFGELRPKLGRMADQRPFYPYTFSDKDFVKGEGAH
jgi:hypothetical protein